jgi:AmmeMemoRadiSam system protein A
MQWHDPHAPPPLPLSVEDKQWLLRLAREALTYYLSQGRELTYQTQSPALLQPRGCFVTLRRRYNGELRGCRGEVLARQPLADSVLRMTIASATDDPRFSPVTLGEAPHLHIEISALTPLHPLRLAEIVIGKHGLLIAQGNRLGLLLPQVAVEHGWDAREFLRNTCHKAGLPDHAWQAKGAELYGFECEVWEEEK